MRDALPRALAMVIALGASTAHAQEPSERTESRSPAERLFEDGRELLARGQIEQACARFDASHKLQPAATGPLVNLALCHEQRGRYASAARLYRDVITKARGVREDRVSYAEGRLREVAPRISTIRVVVRDTSPGLSVSLDGEPLPRERWNVDVPVDGGEHRVDVDRPGRARQRLTATVEQERGRAIVEVAPPASASTPGDRTPGLVVGGIGAAALAIGVGFGASVAIECGGFFQDTCEGPNAAPTRAERDDALSSVETRAWIANVAVGAGVAALAVGAVLYFTASPKDKVARAAALASAAGGLRVAF